MTDLEIKNKRLFDYLEEAEIDLRRVKEKLINQKIETPSWGYGDSGTRFKTFSWPGAARNIYEKIADAGYVQKLTGVAPSIALHLPWDKTLNWNELTKYAAENGISIGAINPNLFQENQYKLGSLCNPDKKVREYAIEYLQECCEIMKKTGSKILSVWLADGTNYAGQDDIMKRKEYLLEGLQKAYNVLPADARMLIEYKFFEPHFYHTDLADWGMAYVVASKCGPKAQVLVDTGHHPQGTNIPHIVSFLLSENKLGGFHFNARKYADDDLIVGSENPFELFDIFVKIVLAGEKGNGISYMIDQSHNIEPKIEAMILSIVNCQTAYAKALIVDYDSLKTLQQQGDVLGAHRVLMNAFEMDVLPIVEEARAQMGVPVDPISTYRNDTYAEKVAKERGVSVNGSGYPTDN